MIDLHFLTLVKTRDALAIYAYLAERRGFGDLGKTSYERLAIDLNAADVATSRGAEFTAAVVRTRLAELVKIGATSIEKVSKNAFRLCVFSLQKKGASENDSTKEASEKNDSVDFQNETVERHDESTLARGEEVLIINNINNKKINKQTSEILKVEETAARVDEPSSVARPSTDDLRTRIDWANPKVAAFRAAIVRKCWEPRINPDLIDRIAALAILKIGGFDSKRVDALLRNAVDARTRYEQTNGRSGNPTLWKTLGYSVKRVYEGDGWTWTRTRIANEPEPKSTPIVAIGQGTLERTPKAEPTVAPRGTEKSAFVYSDEECLGDFDRLAKIVARREGLAIGDAMGRAYALRLERRGRASASA